MPEVLASPTIVPAASEPPKEIAEFMGNASTGDDAFSVARMRTEDGWVEPAQVAQFDELTYVVSGEVHIEHDAGVEQVNPREGGPLRPGNPVPFKPSEAE